MSASPTSGEALRCPLRDDHNPFAPETTAAPHAVVAEVASEDPVFFNSHAGWWIVAGYDEVCEVLRDTESFSSRGSILAPIETDRSAELAPKGVADEYPSLINNDPPEHKRVRKLANQAFTPSAIRGWAPIVKERVTTLLDDLVEKGECEFVSSFSAKLPIVVISEILGIPEEEEANVFNWSASLLAVRLPQLDDDARNQMYKWNGEWTEYLDEMIDDRRRNPRDDMFSQLVQASGDGDEAKLSNDEMRSVVSHLLIAGNETTRQLINTLVLRLIERPYLAKLLVDNEALAEQVVEEELRLAGPSRGTFRIATRDVTLGTATIRKGDRIHVCNGAANLDERKFNDALEFDPDRPDLNQHIAFGRGEHFCLGAPLARLEAKIALLEIVARMPNLRRADDEPISWQPNVIIAGLEHLDIRWDA